MADDGPPLVTITCPVCSRPDVKIMPAVMVSVQEFFRDRKLVLDIHDHPDGNEYRVRCPASSTVVTHRKPSTTATEQP